MKFLLIPGLLLSLSAMASAPQWFSDFEKTVNGCDQNYLCVTGEGASLNEALGMSRTEAAKFFQTKIQSETHLTLTSEQKTVQSGNPAGKYDEWTNKTLSEETNEILSGLEIKKQEEREGRYYVVMGLNKFNTAKEILSRIEELDQSNEKAFELNSRFTYPRILKNLSIIDGLTDRHRLVSSQPVKLKVKREEVLEKINRLKPLKLAMLTKGKKLPAKLSHIIIDLLSPLKLIIVSSKTKPKYSLISEVIIEDQYFKVEGFRKLNVNWRVELQNSQKLMLGKISALSEQVARTSEQAMEKAAPELKDYLQEHLDEITTIKMED
jgi:hypothetical protein